MNKKIAAAIAALMMTVSFAGCGEKNDTDSGKPKETTPIIIVTAPKNPTEAPTEAADEEQAKPTESADEEAPTKAEDENADDEKGGFTVNEDGAGELQGAVADQSDSTIIEMAESIFELACQTEWNYTVGSPFELDTSEYVEGKNGWQYYLVTESGINSMDDVYREYRKLFSEKYPDDLSELFMEKDGRVYCLNGARGSDIFYTGSEISEITERSEDTIVMNVKDRYDESDAGQGAYVVDRVFAIVKGEDGLWRVAAFQLPY